MLRIMLESIGLPLEKINEVLPQGVQYNLKEDVRKVYRSFCKSPKRVNELLDKLSIQL